MKVEGALGKLVMSLNRAGVPHMIAGSFASTFHGLSRTTVDIDVVIDPNPSSLSFLLNLLAEQGFYVSEANARAAFRLRTQFNVIHMAHVWKVDLIIRKERPFSYTEFNRREAATILEVDTFVASAEDTILAKLEWSKESDSERQRRDIEGIIQIKGHGLDRGYLERWSKELGVSDALSRLPWPKVGS